MKAMEKLRAQSTKNDVVASSNSVVNSAVAERQKSNISKLGSPIIYSILKAASPLKQFIFQGG